MKKKLEKHTKYAICDTANIKIAVIRGTRIYLTKEGTEKSYLIIKHPDYWVLKNKDGLLISQINHQPAELFKEYAELILFRASFYLK